MKIGDIVKYNNYEWYITKINNESVTLMMADVLSDDDINELFDDKTYVDGNDVVYSKNNDNDWANTYIREVLNSKFLDKFNKEELNLMRTNYSENKFADDYVRIPTAWEIRELDEDIRYKGESYWTMTASPYYFNGGATTWYVISTGSIYYNYVTYCGSVRPAVSLKTEILNKNELDSSSDLEKRLNELEDRVRKLEAGND